jgi:hypothetical protein
MMSKPKSLPDRSLLEKLFDYNAETGQLRWKTTKAARVKPGDLAGRKTNRGYIHVRVNYKTYPAHRIAWLLITGEDPYGSLIDHIDGNPSNNAFCNLRKATPAQNTHNSKTKKNLSGLKGAAWCKNTGKWRSRITCNGRVFELGRFDDPLEAHAAYCKAAAELHGDFARAA